MVSFAMKKKAERRLRELLAEAQVAEPDEVEYGPRSITMFWHSVKKSISVDVTEDGQIGESRGGPPPPKWSSSDDGRVMGLAALRKKRQAEQSVRAMLDDHGLSQPDAVEYGATCIRLLWHEEKLALIIDIDNGPEIDDPPPGSLENRPSNQDRARPSAT